ncbi:MAG: dolichyl-phosphate beta-glucosyltransferase [Bradymonadia bacterium]
MPILPPDQTLSIVIPAYNEAARIGVSLRNTLDYLDAHVPSHEVIVVDDGSSDETAEVVAGMFQGKPHLRVIRYTPNRGKGHAVRTGMLSARGDYVVFTDADGSTPIEEVEKLLFHLQRGADMVMGSRGLPESEIRQRQHIAREMMGRTFNLILRSTVMGGFKDTQCGFKGFTAEAASALFGAAQIDGFAFDVELLLLAKERFIVKEVPVVWYNAPHSRVSPIKDSAKMLRDVARVRWKLMRR